MDNKYKILEKFGLSDKEIKIYLECLKHDESSPYSLSKATRIPRTTVYDVLMDLALKRLVELKTSDGLTKQQTRVKARNPSELRKTVRRRRKSLDDLEIDLLEILPELKGDYHKSEPNADFKFYPGIEGAKKVYFGREGSKLPYEDIAWTYLIRADSFGTKKIDIDMADIVKNVKSSGKKIREIVPLNDWTRDILVYTFIRNPDFFDVWEYRYIDSPMFEMFLRIAIQGNRLRITCLEQDEVWGLQVNSKMLSKSIKSIFEITWINAEPISKEMLADWKKGSVFSQLDGEKKS